MSVSVAASTCHGLYMVRRPGIIVHMFASGSSGGAESHARVPLIVPLIGRPT
jgi:hypothetical protein